MVEAGTRRRARWAVPFVIIGALALVAWVPTLSTAATPDLPAITAEQLIQKVATADVSTLSGTVEINADLGIPNVSSLGDATNRAGFSPLSLLSGVHRADVAYDGPTRQRVTMRRSLGETGLYRDGRELWMWESAGQLATHTVLPDKAGGGDRGFHASAPPMPADLARDFLDAVTPSTEVTVGTPATVAGQPAYTLEVTPKSADSTIDHIAIAVDAKTGLPLNVGVFTKGATDPALEVGFTSLSYDRPGGDFSFTPPAGATVIDPDNPNEALGLRPRRTDTYYVQPGIAFVAPLEPDKVASEPVVVGTDWGRVAILDALELPRGLRDIVGSATPVKGPFGSGAMLRTRLVNVLFLSDGRVAAGFVTPSALQAAVPPAKTG